MIPQRFLLAVPREWTKLNRIDRVSRASQIAVEHPALWCDRATRIVDIGRRGMVLGPLFGRGALATSSDICCNLPPDAGVAELAARLVGEFWLCDNGFRPSAVGPRPDRFRCRNGP